MTYETVEPDPADADADTLVLDDVIRIALRRAFEDEAVAARQGRRWPNAKRPRDIGGRIVA